MATVPLTLTTSLAHQVKAIELSKDREYFGLLMEQGTGKTHVIIATAVHLWQEGKINLVVVLAPNGVHDNWAKNEIPIHCPLGPDEMRIGVWHSSDGTRGQARFNWALEPLVELTGRSDQLVIILANIEAVRTERFMEIMTNFVSANDTMMVVDESTVIKNPQAAQTKATMKLARLCKYRRIMTGTPITQGPLDAWSQCMFLSPTAIPYPSYTAFKNQFAIERLQLMGRRMFRQVVGYRNLEQLGREMQPFTYRVLKVDCLDLPPKVYETHYLELTPEQRSTYKTLIKQCLVMANDKMMTTTMAITQLLRLHQITLGYMRMDDGTMVQLPNNRINALKGIIESTSGKVIIFCRFKEEIGQICAALSEGTWVRYTGDESGGERTESIRLFQENESTRFFIATSAAARGLTLTAAEAVIYYSQGFSLEIRLQSEDRAHRIGQHKTVVYTDMVARGTVDETVIASLRNKQEIADTIVDPQRLFSQLAEAVNE